MHTGPGVVVQLEVAVAKAAGRGPHLLEKGNAGELRSQIWELPRKSQGTNDHMFRGTVEIPRFRVQCGEEPLKTGRYVLHALRPGLRPKISLCVVNWGANWTMFWFRSYSPSPRPPEGVQTCCRR